MLVLSENYIKALEVAVRVWASALKLVDTITATPLSFGTLRRT
jgi:hypothetical protein